MLLCKNNATVGLSHMNVAPFTNENYGPKVQLQKFIMIHRL